MDWFRHMSRQPLLQVTYFVPKNWTVSSECRCGKWKQRNDSTGGWISTPTSPMHVGFPFLRRYFVYMQGKLMSVYTVACYAIGSVMRISWRIHLRSVKNGDASPCPPMGWGEVLCHPSAAAAAEEMCGESEGLIPSLPQISLVLTIMLKIASVRPVD